jgi:Protein of unknown function (DUF1236)
MRKFLLASVAVTALVAGPAVATAQVSPRAQDVPSVSSQQPAPKGSARDDIDKKRGPSAQSGERRDTTGSSGAQSSPMTDKAPKGGLSGEGRAAGSDQPASKDKGSQSTQDMKREDKSNAAQKSGPSQMKKETTGASQGAHEQGKQDQGKSNAQKSGQSDTKAQGGQLNDQKPGQPKAGSSTQSNQPNQRSTTGQSPSDQPMKGDRANRGNPPSGQQGQTPTESRTGTSETVNQRNQTGSAQSSTSSSTSVTQEQQTKFNQVIEKQKVQSVTNVNFSVSVGSTVPRSVRFHDVPREIVTVYPEYRDKKFIVVREEIVIIEPRTNKVVSVIPRSGRATTGTSTSVRQTTSSKLQLSQEKKRKIHDIVMRERVSPVREDIRLTVGEDVPRTLEFHTFSEEIVTEVPEIRSYRFFVKDNDVILVDPGEHRIVEVID